MFIWTQEEASPTLKYSSSQVVKSNVIDIKLHNDKMNDMAKNENY